MTFKSDERIRETSTTIGTGTYTLAGAPTGFQAVSAIGANNYGPFFITDGTDWEVIIGQYLSGPDRLTRDAVIASSNADAAVNWLPGTRTIRSGWPAWLALPRVTTKSIAGGAGTTTLTQNEQRCDILILTGVITGNRVVEVDATPWRWPQVLNSTTGAFTVTFKVTGQTGFALQRSRRVAAVCDGTDVRHVENVVQRKAADVASAGTVDLNVDGDVCELTGTTTITAITLEEGREVTTRFTGALTLTNGASLVNVTGANITTAAGDYAVWRGYAAGVVRMTDYVRTNGKPLTLATAAEGASMALLGTATASASATIDFTSKIDNTYDAYLITLAGVAPATDGVNLLFRASTDNGSSFLSTNEYYNAGLGVDSATGTVGGRSGAASTSVTLSNNIGNGANQVTNGHIILERGASRRAAIQYALTFVQSGGGVSHANGSGHINANGVNAIRFLMSSGNIASGEFAIWGLKKA